MSSVGNRSVASASSSSSDEISASVMVLVKVAVADGLRRPRVPVLVKVAVAEALRRARLCERDMVRVVIVVVIGFCETEGMLGPRYSDKGVGGG